MLKYEFLKLWKNKGICAVVLCFLLLNTVAVWHKTTQFDEVRQCFPNDWKLAHQELSEVSSEKQTKWMENEIQEAMDGGIWTTRINAFRHILHSKNEVEQYAGYLESIREQALLMGQSSLFSEQDAFSKRNASFIPGKYQHLEGLELKYEDSQGVLLAIDERITDFCIVMVLAVLGFGMVCIEREEGMMSFQRTTKHGIGATIRAKLLLLLLGGIGTTWLFYGSNLLLADWFYGLGDGSRWIQSVEGFLTSPWKITVGQFLLGFLLMKSLVVIVIAFGIAAVSLLGKSTLQIVLNLAAISVGEYVLYAWIPTHSWLDVLKKCNLFYLMRTERFFNNYETVNVLGYPIPSWLLCGGFAIALGGALFTLSLGVYERVSSGEYVQKTRKRAAQRKERGMHSVFYYEAYKFLWIQGAVWILIAALGIQGMTYWKEVPFYTLNELYYQAYMKHLEGEVTEEKLEFLREEGIRLSQMKKPAEEQLDAYQRILRQTERIGAAGVYADEVAYGKLLNPKEQLLNMGKLLILLILSCYSIFVVEKTSGMSSIWNSIAKGREKIVRNKWTLLTGYVLAACVLLDGIYTMGRTHTLEITSLFIPMAALEGFGVWQNFSVFTYILVSGIAKFCVGILCVKAIEMISRKAKNAVNVLLIAGSSFVIIYLLVWMLVMI